MCDIEKTHPDESSQKPKTDDYWFGRWLSKPTSGEEVVISGMSGKLPESNNIYEFSHNLYNKVDMITADTRRWNTETQHEATRRAGRILEIDYFDAGYFGFHHRQANYSDPMLRILLECAIEAIMDAGLHPNELAGTRTAVFVGATTSDTEKVTLNEMDKPQQFGMTGFLRSMLANRMSYFLKVNGPSVIVDTACSSYLNVMEHAFKTIRSGQCDMALVGCCNMNCHPGSTINFHRLGVLSIDGVPRVFDEGANGYVRSESIGCLFLQKAKDSRRIYCRIVHSKINDDGYKKEGITVPSIQVQSELLREVYNESELHVDEIAYLEAHATGTKIGDPQEVEAIDLAIGKLRSKRLWIGSVKSNLGHTEPCSGYCSIVKVLLAFETGFIPPNINFNKPREGIEAFVEKRMRVVTDSIPIEEEKALIGINNFGFGGNNCHMAVRRFNKAKINKGNPDDDLPRLVCASARSFGALNQILVQIKNQELDAEFISLIHMVYYADSDTNFYRGYCIVDKNGSTDNNIAFTSFRKKSLYILFGNCVKNFRSLGRCLWDFPVFKNTMKHINALLAMKNINLDDIMNRDKASEELDVIGSVAIQLGIADTLNALELNPKSVFGHSFGKIVLAYYEKKLSLGDAVSMICSYVENYFTIKDYFDQIFADPSRGFGGNFSRPNYFSTPEFNDDYLIIRKKDILFSFEQCEEKSSPKYISTMKFLDILGSLYQQGYNINLYKLYPKIQFPVSRSTPMISPILQWNHEKPWRTYKFNESKVTKAQQKDYRIFLQIEEDKYIAGHIIDGRNLFPATGYLYLVWTTLASTRNLLPNDIPVIFENCRFIRAVNVPSKGSTKLFVTIRRGNGDFEVLEDDSLVVSGRINMLPNIESHRSGVPSPNFTQDDPELGMTQDEIYRELNLRGYNYNGLFKGLAKCNMEGTKGIIKWENNWVTFIDKMLQLKILQYDTRLLYVPVGINRLIVDPIGHIEMMETVGEERYAPVYSCQYTNTVICGGVEIQGLYANSIPRRRQLGEPVLEKYEFVPNESSLTLEQSLRADVQIILENSLEGLIKSAEIIDDATSSTSNPLLPLILEIVGDIPLVKCDFTISSKTELEGVNNIKVEPVNLTSENTFLLLIGTDILQRPAILQQFIKSIKENGFILSREGKESSILEQYKGLAVLTIFTTCDEKLVLLRKEQEFAETVVIETTSDKFDWITKLQEAIQNNRHVTVFSQNELYSGILGLINCLRREPNGDKIRGFFIEGDAPQFDSKKEPYCNQMTKNFAINVYKNKQWGTYRHLLLGQVDEVDKEHGYINVTVRGNLSSLKWIEGPLSRDGPNSLRDFETLVIPYYAAINFRDIMTASGRINPDVVSPKRLEQECVQGFEFAGRDPSGKRVMGFITGGALATIVKADVNLLWDVPEPWSLEDAATVPVVYGTVLYALMIRNSIKCGCSILIHAGSGGIGIAAINVALYYGMVVFTTVGTEEKREFIKKSFPQIPESHIGNSRNISFEDMINRETKGRGVDIVLNSLADEKLMASARCLAQGGNFIEIGKFNLSKNTALELYLLRKEASFQGVMLDKLFSEPVDFKKELINHLNKAIAAGYIKPLPRSVFEEDEIEKAFRFMAGGKHIGKVLIHLRDEEPTPICEPSRKLINAVPRFYCNPKRVQIVVGGLGGIGLELADWLVLRGARKVILTSRNGVTSQYQALRKKIWESYGVEVEISTADITTLSGTEDLIRGALEQGPIEGVFNLAVVLKDALFEKQTEENFVTSFAPKALATKNLDEVTRKLCPKIKYFVVFSSVSCGRGNPGQTNYAMANAVMERICEKRKQEGFSALAIQWGAIGDVGLVARMQKDNRVLEIGGTLQQKISSCIEVMDVLMSQDSVIVASMLVAEKRRAFAGSAVDAVAHILGIKDIKSVNPATTLAELGMDSITGTEIYQVLEKDFEITMKPEDMRTLTFGKLMELEAEKKRNAEGSTDKTKMGISMMLKYFPDVSLNEDPIVKMASKIDNEVKAPTIFMFPGIEGCLKDLEILAKNIEAHVYGIQYSFSHPEATIEGMAKAVYPSIEKILPKEEMFTLLGYSLGAIIGLEVAALLEANNYKVNFIALDGSPAYTTTALKQFTANTTDEVELETLIVCGILGTVLPIEKIAENREKILKCNNYKDRITLGMSLVPRDDISKEKNESIIAEAMYYRYKCLLGYEYIAAKLNSPVFLYRASHPMLSEVDEDYKLNEICASPVKVVVLEGDHVSILSNEQLFSDCNKIIKGDIIDDTETENSNKISTM